MNDYFNILLSLLRCMTVMRCSLFVEILNYSSCWTFNFDPDLLGYWDFTSFYILATKFDQFLVSFT